MLSIFQRTGLSFERLKTFCEVVDAGGISHAAPGDPNRQSQFSRQIKELEEFFGTRLMNRVRGKFGLSPAGSELHAIAESHFRALDNLLRRSNGKTTSVRIAGGESVLHGVLLPILPQLKSKFPAVMLELFNCRTEETLARLRDSRADFGLIMDKLADSDLATEVIGHVRLGIFVPTSLHPRPHRIDVWSMIQKHPVAALAGSRAMERLRSSAQERNIDIRPAFLGSSFAQIVEAAKSLNCLAVVPDFFISHEGRSQFLPLKPEEMFSQSLLLAWKPRNLALQAHGNVLRETLAALIARIVTRAS